MGGISIKMKVKGKLQLNINLDQECVSWLNLSFVIKKECQGNVWGGLRAGSKNLLRKMNAIMESEWDGWSGIITSSATLC